MKKSIYNRLEDIPEADRGDYVSNTHAGSPHFNKYILQLDGLHPVQINNAALKSEKDQQATQHQAALLQKDTQITNLTRERDEAKTSQGLPAGQMAITTADFTLLNELKALGDPKDIKEKLEEFPKLKESVESVQRKEVLTAAAKAHGLDPDAFILLAEPKNLAASLDVREIDDGKGGKVKHYFVKHKDANGGDAVTVLSDYVKNSDDFKPFLPSLQPIATKSGVTVPQNGVGKVAGDKTAAATYLGAAYKVPAPAGASTTQA
jgi:hypothetical protein